MQWNLTPICSPGQIFLAHCIHEIQDSLNTLKPKQNGNYFADAIFKCIFLYENIWISIKISLKYVGKGTINDITAFVRQAFIWSNDS